MARINNFEIASNIKVSDVEEFAAQTWTLYFSASDIGLRMEINHRGELRISKHREVIWSGTDISEALLRLQEEC